MMHPLSLRDGGWRPGGYRGLGLRGGRYMPRGLGGMTVPVLKEPGVQFAAGGVGVIVGTLMVVESAEPLARLIGAAIGTASLILVLHSTDVL